MCVYGVFLDNFPFGAAFGKGLSEKTNDQQGTEKQMDSMVPKSRLGRGLASLIGEPAPLGHRLPPEGEQRGEWEGNAPSRDLQPALDG